MPLISHFLYATLKADHRIFADEIDKHNLLFSLQPTIDSRAYPWRIGAFVLTDAQLYLLIACLDPQDSVRREELLRIGHNYLEQYQIQTGRTGENTNLQLDMKVLSDTRSIIECCLFLHMLPSELGLCLRSADYWWSSYQTYRDVYKWKCVEPACIYDLLRPGRYPAGKMFARMHHADQLRCLKESEEFWHFLDEIEPAAVP